MHADVLIRGLHPGMSSCLVRLVERGHCPLPRYQPGLIDPAIAGETEHLVGMVFPYECEFDFDSCVSRFLL